MQDTFEMQWDFFKEFTESDIYKNALQQFKSSKSPKKDWEVVAFRHARGTMDVYKLREDGKFRSDETPTGWGFTLEEMIKDEEIIHSVRRLSDGLTVSCGDIVDVAGYGKLMILGFEITDGKTMRITGGGYALPLEYVKQKLPQAILTTVDGVDIFPGDEYYFIDAGWEIRFTGDNYNWVSDNIKAFADKEEAILYVQENKPLLSLNDVKEVLDQWDFMRETDKDILSDLTALVKQKLSS